MQARDSLETFYKEEDPWGYKKNPDDLDRRDRILDSIKSYGMFERALDIGAGEGFITEFIPAKKIFALECSDNASARLPDGVQRVEEPEGKYDLMLATGVLYPQYDWGNFHHILRKYSSKVVLTCSIKDWEIPLTLTGFRKVHEEEFPYREYTQILKIYETLT